MVTAEYISTTQQGRKRVRKSFPFSHLIGECKALLLLFVRMGSYCCVPSEAAQLRSDALKAKQTLLGSILAAPKDLSVDQWTKAVARVLQSYHRAGDQPSSYNRALFPPPRGNPGGEDSVINAVAKRQSASSGGITTDARGDGQQLLPLGPAGSQLSSNNTMPISPTNNSAVVNTTSLSVVYFVILHTDKDRVALQSAPAPRRGTAKKATREDIDDLSIDSDSDIVATTDSSSKVQSNEGEGFGVGVVPNSSTTKREKRELHPFQPIAGLGGEVEKSSTRRGDSTTSRGSGKAPLLRAQPVAPPALPLVFVDAKGSPASSDTFTMLRSTVLFSLNAAKSSYALRQKARLDVAPQVPHHRGSFHVVHTSNSTSGVGASPPAAQLHMSHVTAPNSDGKLERVFLLLHQDAAALHEDHGLTSNSSRVGVIAEGVVVTGPQVGAGRQRLYGGEDEWWQMWSTSPGSLQTVMSLLSQIATCAQ